MSLKAPAHLRLTKLRYIERGNLTGLTTAQTTADAMISRVKEEILKTVLRFDAEIKEINVNQQWIHLKAHGVELGRYCNPNGLSQLREEIFVGPSALELPFVPRWVSGQENLLNMARNGLKFHSSIWFTVKTQAEADRAIRQGIHFGGKFHKVEKYLRVGPDTLCPTCCHWGHTIYGCPTPEKKRCAICAESHVTTEHQCPITGCRTIKGEFSIQHGHCKCANCEGKHMAASSKCPVQKQAIAIARSGREEWRDREREHEQRHYENDDNRDI